jgi:hypothetical protein
MKYWIAAAGLLFSATVGAQRYQTLNYRDNDPFVFCTYGQLNPARCWWPISAAAGLTFEDPTCDPPNAPDGRPWTPDDYESLKEWTAICPGVGQGPWKGTGTGEQVPYAH